MVVDHWWREQQKEEFLLASTKLKKLASKLVKFQKMVTKPDEIEIHVIVSRENYNTITKSNYIGAAARRNLKLIVLGEVNPCILAKEIHCKLIVHSLFRKITLYDGYIHHTSFDFTNE